MRYVTKGYLFVHGDSANCGVTIFYREDLTVRERRVVIAHELGHALFHVDLSRDKGRVDCFKGDHDGRELEANYFAEVAMKDRTKQYRNKKYIEESIYTQSEIRAIIKAVYPDYNPDDLPY